ncbi:MAG: rhomboid family intramembrane serine protease, partial [Dermatophilaceae bacterium]|nr:rhomboid family intramembrane serine protease [Dermatophilaceae bacterium]
GFLPGISWQTHLGGLVTGVAVAGGILATRAPERRRWQWPLLALIFVVLVGACVAKYLTVPVFYR